MSQDDSKKGWYSKYTIGKSDGSPVDPKAVYLVLRLDNDFAARQAARRYAALTNNIKLADDIVQKCADIEN